MRRLPAKAAIALLVGAAAACGPIQAASYVSDLHATLKEAGQMQAEKLAPYEWTTATLYLAKAKEEIGESQYEVAVAYLKKAQFHAERAHGVAERSKPKRNTSELSPLQRVP